MALYEAEVIAGAIEKLVSAVDDLRKQIDFTGQEIWRSIDNLADQMSCMDINIIDNE